MSYVSAFKSIDRTRFLVIVWTALLPLISVIMLPLIFYRVPFTNFVPHYWNDQVSYARQIATVHAVGLEGGYYTIDEKPALFSRFYAHGPMFPLVYGLFGQVTGWNDAIGLAFNAAFLSAGLVFFIVSASLSTRQCLWLNLVYLTWWMIQLYIISLSQEVFHHAAALVFAGIFVHLFRDKYTIPRKMIIPGILFVVFMGMMRVSWMLLCVPLFLGLIPRWRVRWIIGALVTAGLLTVGVYVVSGWIAAPGASSITRIVNEILTDPGKGFAGLMGYMVGNFEKIFLDLKEVLREYNFIWAGVQIIQMLVLIIAACLHLIRRNRIKQGNNTSYWMFVMYMLVSIVILSCAVYLHGGFNRIFAVTLFICVCLLVALHQYKLLAVILVLNLLCVRDFVDQFPYYAPSFQLNLDDVRQWRAEASEVLAYQADAPSPWCNTILIDIFLYDYHVSVLPPEMGIGWYSFGSFPEPMKSHYYYATERVEKPFLRELTEFSFGGILYENVDVRAQCLTS